MPRQKKSHVRPPDPVPDMTFEFGKIETLILVAGILLVLLLVYTIQVIVSPFIVLGSILFVLYPLRSHSLARNFMWLSVILFILWLSIQFSGSLRRSLSRSLLHISSTRSSRGWRSGGSLGGSLLSS